MLEYSQSTLNYDFNAGYKDSLVINVQKKNTLLKLIDSQDPYEILWKDDVDLWPSTTYINVGMHLLFSPSPYTQEDLENNKSLECYQRFIAEIYW